MRKSKLTVKKLDPSPRNKVKPAVTVTKGEKKNSKNPPYMMFADPQPAFPSDVSIDDAKLRLHADGSFEGDVEKFIEAAKNLKIGDGDGILVVVVWGIINSIRNRNAKKSST